RQSVEDELGVVLSRSEFFYDDETFSGTNLGEVSIGNLTLQRSWVDPASPTNYINATRSRYDPFGNRIALIDPLGDPAGNPAQGHVQEIVYDEAFHTYPSQEILHIGDARPPLIFAAD